MHTTREASKTPCADVYRLVNVIAGCPFCDVGHATIGLTNLANYSSSATVSLLFYLILNIRLNPMLAYSQSSCEPQCLTPN